MEEKKKESRFQKIARIAKLIFRPERELPDLAAEHLDDSHQSNLWKETVDGKPILFGPYDRENPKLDASYSYIQDNLAYWKYAMERDKFDALTKYLNQETSDDDCILFDHVFDEYENPISFEQAAHKGGIKSESVFANRSFRDEFPTLNNLTGKPIFYDEIDRFQPT